MWKNHLDFKVGKLGTIMLQVTHSFLTLRNSYKFLARVNNHVGCEAI